MKSQCHLLSQVSEKLLQMVADQISLSVPASSLPPQDDSPLLLSFCLLPLVICSAPAGQERTFLSLVNIFVFIKTSLSVFDGGSSLERHVPELAITIHLSVHLMFTCLNDISVSLPTQTVKESNARDLCSTLEMQCQWKCHKNALAILPLKGVHFSFKKHTHFNTSL